VQQSAAGVELTGVFGTRHLQSFPLPKSHRIRNVHGESGIDRADLVRHAVENICREYHITHIEFPALCGLAVRCLQAKHCGIAFGQQTIRVILDDCHAHQRKREQRYLASLDELEVEYLERYSVENADALVTSEPEVLSLVKSLGWDVRDREKPARNIASRPLVSVCVPHYNLGEYLPATLQAIQSQSYRNLEVVIIDDGSTDYDSVRAFLKAQHDYPQFRFLRQANAGIGATRNRGLELAQGRYFIPIDADNLPCAEMVTKLVDAIERRPELTALSCDFLAFRDEAALAAEQFEYVYRPSGGPLVLAALRNVYGDACAIYNTERFRQLGGYETDRGTSYEDWEAFVKIVRKGHRLDVYPEPLFYYRHLESGFSRRTNQFNNHQRVLRQFEALSDLPLSERVLLWQMLAGLVVTPHQRDTARSRWTRRVRDAIKWVTEFATATPKS
jgi:GT2 family glycosyltransferase